MFWLKRFFFSCSKIKVFTILCYLWQENGRTKKIAHPPSFGAGVTHCYIEHCYTRYVIQDIVQEPLPEPACSSRNLREIPRVGKSSPQKILEVAEMLVLPGAWTGSGSSDQLIQHSRLLHRKRCSLSVPFLVPKKV